MNTIKSAPLLIDAVCSAFNSAQPGEKWAPSLFGATYCNRAVNSIAVKMGYASFARASKEDPDNAILANEMFDAMSERDGDWMTVPGEIAQLRADDGELVIAAQKDPNGHGHVCVLIPGTPEESDSWGKPAPKVMNVGRSVFIGKRASWAFKTEPAYFILKTTGEA